AIVVLLTSAIARPITRIIYASRRFAKGEFAHRIHYDSRDEIGSLAGTLNQMAQDIEEKIRHLQFQNQQLRSVFESMVEGMILVDKEQMVLSVNSTVEKIFGVARQEAEGRLFLEAIRNADIAEVVNLVLARGEAVSRELSIVWPVKKTFQINAAPIFETGAVAGCLLVVHDITEIRRLETIRSDFVANVSHELKTPLTSIKGFVETLAEGALEDKANARHFLSIIQEHADRLNNLINDLLDLSYLESKEIVVAKEELSLKNLIDRVVSGFQSQARKKTVQVYNEVSDKVRVRADRAKLEQVLTNLVDNAIKFNKEKGSIRILSSQDAAGVRVAIEDTGLGIPAKDIPRIFERFYRVDKARSRELGGTGLGLSIVKHIVELHAGSVGVESTEGLGATFWFILPL
ncbi:MAG: ATP-binding protein, partial [Candidatus Omnitrophica bacterium]|nr:ATP-binding protein [Candidatus Omnitrophota bacterium]